MKPVFWQIIIGLFAIVGLITLLGITSMYVMHTQMGRPAMLQIMGACVSMMGGHG